MWSENSGSGEDAPHTIETPEEPVKAQAQTWIPAILELSTHHSRPYEYTRRTIYCGLRPGRFADAGRLRLWKPDRKRRRLFGAGPARRGVARVSVRPADRPRRARGAR